MKNVKTLTILSYRKHRNIGNFCTTEKDIPRQTNVINYRYLRCIDDRYYKHYRGTFVPDR